MTDIYVNLHPTYSYSNVIISNGNIPQLKEYVKLVEWLAWDWHSLKGYPIIQISGGFSNDENSKAKHIEYTNVVLQRIMKQNDCNILIRNSRGEEWSKYIPKQMYTEKEMYEFEVQRLKESDQEKWIKSDIDKFKKMLIASKDKTIERMISESMDKLREIEEAEKMRKEKLKQIWI